MKRTLALYLAAALLLGVPLVAQQGPGGGPGPGGRRGEHRMGHQRGPNPEQRLQNMSQRLNLSQEQQDKLKPILQEQTQQMQAVRNDTSLSVDQRRAKMLELHQNFTNQINSVLTPEQQKQWEQIRQQRWDRQRKGGRGGAPPSNPNPSL